MQKSMRRQLRFPREKEPENQEYQIGKQQEKKCENNLHKSTNNSKVVHCLSNVSMWAAGPHLHRLLIICLGFIIAISAPYATGITSIEKAIDITATALADQVSIVRWRANAYRLGSTTKKVAEIMSLGVCQSGFRNLIRYMQAGGGVPEFAKSLHQTHSCRE